MTSLDPKATHLFDTVDHTGVLAEVLAVQEIHLEELASQTGVERLIAAQVLSSDGMATHSFDTVDQTGPLAKVSAVQEIHFDLLLFQTGLS